MKISKCTHGKIVCTQNRDGEVDQVGMIIGITNNCPKSDHVVRKEKERINILVQWSYGETTAIHPSNLVEYKD